MIQELESSQMEMLWYERVPYYMSYTDEAFKATYESLRDADPRVIVASLDAGYATLCWLHRYRLFGPNYAIFIIKYADSNTYMINIPDYISHMCTVEMVREVMNHSFVYGSTNRADIFKNIPDDVGMTWAKFEEDIHNRVYDAHNAFWIYESCKYWYYDLFVYLGMMMNEVEGILKLRNDSLANWSMNSDNYKQNSEYIIDLMKDVMYNIKVVGMRGTYAFQRNTTLNTGGFTPITVMQLFTFPNRSDVRQELVAYYDSSKPVAKRLEIYSEKIIWTTLDGKPPFDRVQIKRIDVHSLEMEGMIVLMVIAIAVSVANMVPLLRHSSYRSMENILIISGVLICMSHVFLLPLRDIEPIALHCSIFAGLILIGLSTFFIGMWVKLEVQFLICQQWLKQSLTGGIGVSVSAEGMTSSRNSNGNSFQLPKIQKITIYACQLSNIVLGCLFILSSPIQAIGNEATLATTFAHREVTLSTHRTCTLTMHIFSLVTLLLNIGIVSIVVLKSLFVAYEIQIVKRKMKTLKPKTRKQAVLSQKNAAVKDSGHFLGFILTILIGFALVLALVKAKSFYITAVSSLTVGVIAIVMLSVT